MRWNAAAEAAATEGDFSFLDNNGTEGNASDDAARIRANNASWSSALRVRGETAPAGGRTFSISAEWLRRRQGVPGIDAFQSDAATFSLLRGIVRAEAAWHGLGRGSWDMKAALDHEYTSESFGDPERRIAPVPVDSVTRVAGTGAGVRLLWRPSAAHRISFLMEPRWQGAGVIDHVDPNPDPIRARRGSLAAVVEDEIHLASGRLLIAPSVRHDRISDRSRGGGPSPDAAAAGRFSAVSGRIGGLVALSPRLCLRGNVGRFYRAPDLLELYGNQGTILGNPDLRPERGVNADLGVSLHGAGAPPFDRISLEIAAFRTDAGDLIQFVSLPSRIVKAFNAGRARVTGVEASASLRLLGAVTASANVTVQKPVDRSDTFRAGFDLPGRPRREADTSVSVALGRTTLFHRFSYVGENDISAAVSGAVPSSRTSLTHLPARYLHDAGLGVRLGGRAEGTLEVVNLLDRRVVDVARFPLPGRALFAKFTAAF